MLVNDKQFIGEEGVIYPTVLKLSPAEAGYEVISEDSTRACALCRWFHPETNTCHIVDGVINAAGTSNYFLPLNPPEPELEEGDSEELEATEEEVEAYEEELLVKALSDWQATAERPSLMARIKALFTSAPPPTIADELLTGEVGFKVLGDSNRWVAWYTNAYQDREDEWFAEKGIERDVARMWKSGNFPELWFWHIPGTKHGQADWAGTQGRFAIAVGTFDDTPEAQAFKAYYQTHPHALSHGFLYRKADKQLGVYKDFRTFEISTLPPQKAANPYTFYALEEGADMKMTKEQFEGLAERIGIDAAIKMIGEAEDATKTLDKNGVGYKSVDEDVPQVDVATEARVKSLEEKMDAMFSKLDILIEQKSTLAPAPDSSPLSGLDEAMRLKLLADKEQHGQKHVQDRTLANLDEPTRLLFETVPGFKSLYGLEDK